MVTVKDAQYEIEEIEGFEVTFYNKDGRDTNDSKKVSSYSYSKAAKGAWTVEKWRNEKFKPLYPDLTVSVWNGGGEECYGQTLLRTVRESYE